MEHPLLDSITFVSKNPLLPSKAIISTEILNGKKSQKQGLDKQGVLLVMA